METIKLLEKKHRGKPYNTGFGNEFLDMTSKVLATKEKEDIGDFIKILHQRILLLQNGSMGRRGQDTVIE